MHNNEPLNLAHLDVCCNCGCASHLESLRVIYSNSAVNIYMYTHTHTHTHTYTHTHTQRAKETCTRTHTAARSHFLQITCFPVNL